jgi:3-hydroxybutyryl-CoA dehydrogenase
VDLVSRGAFSAEELDDCIRSGYGCIRGPSEVLDDVGLDTYLQSARSFEEFGEEGLVPCLDMIKRMIDKGNLGRKSGQGFYHYSDEGDRLPFWLGRGFKGENSIDGC